jgi:tRNA pseudouridine38/39 synthase
VCGVRYQVLGWAPCELDFSARFAAQARRYKYFFFQDDLNIPLMQEAGTAISIRIL